MCPDPVEAERSGTYLPLKDDGKLDTGMSEISLTERAARRINEIMAVEPSGSMLRISVNGGGCSGFQYAFDVERNRQAEDIVIERDGATVLVDQVSLPFLEGSTVDFVDDLIGQSFKIQNPHATASCGCGTSFSV
jgi:iron-sulfur cluster assembly accessory protein